jgi:hypothetical protein
LFTYIKSSFVVVVEFLWVQWVERLGSMQPFGRLN